VILSLKLRSADSEWTNTRFLCSLSRHQVKHTFKHTFISKSQLLRQRTLCCSGAATEVQLQAGRQHGRCRAPPPRLSMRFNFLTTTAYCSRSPTHPSPFTRHPLPFSSTVAFSVQSD
jgi:hypothetical protein